MSEPRSKFAVITGASSGIGRALAEEMAAAGVQVLAVARSEEKLKGLAKTSKGIDILACDLGSESGRVQLVNAVTRPVDYLVNNAGIESHVGDICELVEKNLLEVLAINLIAPMLITAGLKAQGRLTAKSRVLCTSSRAGDQAFRGVCAYGVSKSGLDAFCRALVEEGYLAASVVPGEVDTEIQRGLRDAEFSLQQFFIDAKEHGRLLSPRMSARFFYFLLCDLDDEEFTGRKHNIYDKSYWRRWLAADEELVTPAGERESNMKTRYLEAVQS